MKSVISPAFETKMSGVGTTIFTVMSALAAQHNAINLGQGFPDFPMSEALVAHVAEAMKKGQNQYIHMNGLPALRQKLAAKASRLYGNDIDPDDEITVTPGGTYAIFTALATILKPGDEVVVPEPAYDCYIPTIRFFGGKPVTVAMPYPHFTPDWQKTEAAITPNTRAIIINTPHNPTGKVFSEEDMQALAGIASRHPGLFIISDEVYEHLIFDGIKHQSVLAYPELYARSFACYSFGKTYHCTGWKLGYCIAPPSLTSEFRKVHQFNAFTCNTPMQAGLAAYLEDETAYLKLGHFVQQKRDHFMKGMEQSAFKALPSFGSYFQLYSYAGISNEAEIDFAQRITKEYGIATIPVSAFYAEPVNRQLLRFCFCKKEETLDAALEKLVRIK